MRNVFVLCMMLLCLGIHAQEGVVTDGRFCGNAGDYVIYTRLTESGDPEFYELRAFDKATRKDKQIEADLMCEQVVVLSNSVMYCKGRLLYTYNLKENIKDSVDLKMKGDELVGISKSKDLLVFSADYKSAKVHIALYDKKLKVEYADSLSVIEQEMEGIYPRIIQSQDEFVVLLQYQLFVFNPSQKSLQMITDKCHSILSVDEQTVLYRDVEGKSILYKRRQKPLSSAEFLHYSKLL